MVAIYSRVIKLRPGMRKLEAKYNVVCLEVFVLWVEVGKVVHTVALSCTSRVEPFVADKMDRCKNLTLFIMPDD